MKDRWITFPPGDLIEEAPMIAAANEITMAAPFSYLSKDQLQFLVDADNPLQHLCEHWNDIRYSSVDFDQIASQCVELIQEHDLIGEQQEQQM